MHRVSRLFLRRRNRRRKRSGYEKQVAQWLEEDQISYRQEAAIGQCHVDFLLPSKTIVEVNGCYWHGACSKCCPKPTLAQRAARARDSRRYKYFRSQGFRVVVLRGCELEKNPDGVRGKLRALRQRN